MPRASAGLGVTRIAQAAVGAAAVLRSVLLQSVLQLQSVLRRLSVLLPRSVLLRISVLWSVLRRLRIDCGGAHPQH